MASRKRQLFAVEDVVDILLNGRMPDSSLNEENAAPPVKRVSLPNPVKTVVKLESKHFYGSANQPVKNRDSSTDFPKSQQPLKATTCNSPSGLTLSREAKPTSNKTGNNSDTLSTGSGLKESLKKLETFDSPKSSASKWSNVFFRPSPGSKHDDGSDTKKHQSPFASWMKNSKDKPGETATQAILDAGQKEFGVVQCPECSMVYELKSPDDELLHMKHHESSKETLRFSSIVTKNIPPLRCIDGGLQIFLATKESTLQRPLVSKCEAVLEVANREIKRVTDQPCLEKLTTRHKAYICVDPVSGKVAGLCIAEPIARGFPTMSTAWPIVLERGPRKTISGIRLIWVSPEWRHKGIAKALMECVRSTFVYGCVLSKREIAISPPTVDGFNFFRGYLGGLPRDEKAPSGERAPTPPVVFLVYDN